MLFIDEYDAPIQEGYIREYYDNMIVLMRNLLTFGGEVIYNPCSVLSYLKKKREGFKKWFLETMTNQKYELMLDTLTGGNIKVT